MQRGNGWDVDRVSFTCDLINSRRASCSRQLLRFFNLTMSDAPFYGVSKFARISDIHFFGSLLCWVEILGASGWVYVIVVALSTPRSLLRHPTISRYGHMRL